ncbi:MAG: HEPN domain-containing protein [Elusimicrobiota bacterium]
MNNLAENEKQAVSELVEGLKKLYGDNLSRVILYGSKARGDAEPDSDIDILVVLGKNNSKFDEIHRITEISAPVCLKYDVLISGIPISEEKILSVEKTIFLENVLKEGIVLFSGRKKVVSAMIGEVRDKDSIRLMEIASLVKKGLKSLEAAKKHLEKNEYDFVVSEAYFGMFYLAEALLVTKNLGFSRHSAVISAFGRYFAKTGEVNYELHRILIEAEKERIKGDYLYMEEITKEEAEKVLKDAEYFVAEIKKKLEKK